jgi:dTDP-4-dehydrorhamnose 3,5-epimerase
MRIEQTPLKDCFIIHEKVHGDARGYFIETYNQRDFKAATGLDIEFVQDNQSRSTKGVLRGLHMQQWIICAGKISKSVRRRSFGYCSRFKKRISQFWSAFCD